MLLLRFVSILGSRNTLVTYIDADVGRGRDGCSVLLWVVVVVVERCCVKGRGEERRAERSLNEVIYLCSGPDRTYGIVVEGRRRWCLVSLLSRTWG
jgi:hypothetical protein